MALFMPLKYSHSEEKWSHGDCNEICEVSLMKTDVLLFYRVMPLSNGFSPAEPLMGSQPCTPAPVGPIQLQPHIPLISTI